MIFLLLFGLLLTTGTFIKYEHNETPTFGLASIKMNSYVDGEGERYTKNTLKADVIIKSLRSEISNHVRNYSCPGHRPWARVIICVGFFCIMFPPLENGQIAQ